MRDPLEVAARVGVGEDDLTEAGAVERCRRAGSPRARSALPPHRVRARRRAHDLARELVRVDDRRAVRLEHSINGALASRDSARSRRSVASCWTVLQCRPGGQPDVEMHVRRRPRGITAHEQQHPVVVGDEPPPRRRTELGCQRALRVEHRGRCHSTSAAAAPSSRRGARRRCARSHRTPTCRARSISPYSYTDALRPQPVDRHSHPSRTR